LRRLKKILISFKINQIALDIIDLKRTHILTLNIRINYKKLKMN